MKRGFSLTEVLVVCTVASLLLGVTLPSLARSRRQAQVRVCLSQLHQVHLAYRMAALDRGTEVQHLIGEETYRYTGGEGLWRCVTSTETERRYYLRLSVPEIAPGDAPLLPDPWHRETWLWVTLEGSVRTAPEVCR